MDETQVAARLAHALGLRPTGTPVRVTGGEDFTTFRVDCGIHGALALRITGARRAPFLEIEEAAMNSARAAGVPVPKVIARGTAGDHTAMAVRWVRGVTIMERLLTAPEEALELGRAFGEMQAKIHRADPGPLARLRPLKPRSEREADLLQRALGRPGGARTLLHLDYHPLNVLTEDGEVTGVIDWTNTACGDARLDVARTYGILHLESPREVLPVVRRFIRGWLQGYQGPMDSRDDLARCLAWAGAYMVEDRYGRVDPEKFRRMRAWATGWERRSRKGAENHGP